jgi:hypothetical protein
VKTILYAKGLADSVKTLGNMIQTQLPEIQITPCNSMEEISQTLCQPLHKISVVILPVATRRELSEFYLLNPLFDNTKIILILPDGKKDTLDLAYKLKSSFVSFADGNLQDVILVLGRIQKTQQAIKSNFSMENYKDEKTFPEI